MYPPVEILSKLQDVVFLAANIAVLFVASGLRLTS